MKSINMKEIQKEAKLRYPIGTTFISADSTVGNKILELDDSTYIICGNQIYAHNGAGQLYRFGVWAKIVSYPKDYIIPYSEYINPVISNYEIY